MPKVVKFFSSKLRSIVAYNLPGRTESSEHLPKSRHDAFRSCCTHWESYHLRPLVCASIAKTHISEKGRQRQYVSFPKDVEEIPVGVMEPLINGCFCGGHTFRSSSKYLECRYQLPATKYIFRLTSSFNLSLHEHSVASGERCCE